MPLDWSPLWLSLRYSALATLLAMLAAVPLARLLANHRFPGSEVLDALANLPLVLPPAVLVYYLLTVLGSLTFSWHVAVVVSAIYTLPLVFRMTRGGLAAVGHSFENAARSLGAGEWRIFWRVTLPLAWRALFAAVLAGFARAFVDFGVTALLANSGSSGPTVWPLLPIAALALAALYIGNRIRRGQVPA
jgi:molybdate transport system permease protein